MAMEASHSANSTCIVTSSWLCREAMVLPVRMHLASMPDCSTCFWKSSGLTPGSSFTMMTEIRPKGSFSAQS